MPGDRTLVRKRCFIATIPGWPPCTHFSASGWSFFLVIKFEFHEEQALQLHLEFHSTPSPFKRHSRTLFSSGSFSDALSISRVVKATGVDSWVTHFTYRLCHWRQETWQWICNVLGPWNVFLCKSIGLHPEEPSLYPAADLRYGWENAFQRFVVSH